MMPPTQSDYCWYVSAGCLNIQLFVKVFVIPTVKNVRGVYIPVVPCTGNGLCMVLDCIFKPLASGALRKINE